MIDSKYRKIVQPVFSVIGHALVKTKATPNQITTAALVVGIGAAIAVATKQYALSGILLALSGLLDVLDGTVARLTGNSSKMGAFLDMVFDRMVEGAFILGFYIAAPQFGLFYILFFISVLFNFSTFTVAGALIKNNSNKSMHYDPGFAERTETFITFVLMLIFPQYAGYTLLAFTIIVFLTGVVRFVNIARVIK